MQPTRLNVYQYRENTRLELYVSTDLYSFVITSDEFYSSPNVNILKIVCGVEVTKPCDTISETSEGLLEAEIYNWNGAYIDYHFAFSPCPTIVFDTGEKLQILRSDIPKGLLIRVIAKWLYTIHFLEGHSFFSNDINVSKNPDKILIKSKG